MLATHLCELCLSVVLPHEIDLLQGTLGKMLQNEKKPHHPLQYNVLISEAVILSRTSSNVCYHLTYPRTLPKLLSASPHSGIQAEIIDKPKNITYCSEIFQNPKIRSMNYCMYARGICQQVFLYSRKNTITFIPNLQILQHYQNYAVGFMQEMLVTEVEK